MGRKYYVTTPIYYASGDLHIGHSYTTLAADALARYKRMKGYDVYFLTGTDEHGLKVQRKAEKAGKTPKEFVDGIVAKIKDLWRILGISYDGFIRTTDEHHRTTVQHIFQTLYEKQDIYKAAYESWYCVGCESFYTETQARSFPGMICPDHGIPLERVKEESYFFRLSKYQDKLLDYIEAHPDFIQPQSRRNEVVQFIKGGLEDLCISRTSFTWGIPVPFDPDSVVYVWIDALSNYISAIGYPDDMDRFNRWWPCDLHLIGKEILRFHAIVWPIILMALNLPLPKQVFAHGWLNLGGKKMSKTMGNVVDPAVLVNKYGLDAVRYFVLREVPFGADGDYTEESLVARINADLANDLGNLLYRTVSMIRRLSHGKIPSPGPENETDVEFKRACLAALGRVEEQMDALHIDGALEEIMSLVARANKYIDETAPWSLHKNGDPRYGTVAYYLCECLRIVAELLRPFMVLTPDKIGESLGMKEPIGGRPWDDAGRWGLLVPGGDIGEPLVIFPRVETKPSEVPAQETGRESKPGDEGPTGEMTIEQFREMDLRVGKVISVEKVEGATRLLKLQVDLGTEVRQVVAGIAQHYAPEELLGRNVVVVANLAPAQIKGVQSRGMILAASSGDTLRVITVDGEIAPGSKVK